MLSSMINNPVAKEICFKQQWNQTLMIWEAIFKIDPEQGNMIHNYEITKRLMCSEERLTYMTIEKWVLRGTTFLSLNATIILDVLGTQSKCIYAI